MNNTNTYYNPKQGRLPVFILDILDICDPVLAFDKIMEEIGKKDCVDFQHLYIDGSKFEANANKYTWVWKKATEKSRYRLFAKITDLFTQMNDTLTYTGLKIETNTEYTPDGLETVLNRYSFICHVDEKNFVSGRGRRKR